MMKIQAYKSEQDGKLFEFEADFERHIARLARRRHLAEAIAGSAEDRVAALWRFQNCDDKDEMMAMFVEDYRLFRGLPSTAQKIGVLKSAEMTNVVWGRLAKDYHLEPYDGWVAEIRISWVRNSGPYFGDVLLAMGFENVNYVSVRAGVCTYRLNIPAKRFERFTRRGMQEWIAAIDEVKALPVEKRHTELAGLVMCFNKLRDFRKTNMVPFETTGSLALIRFIMECFPERELMWVMDGDMMPSKGLAERVRDGRVIRVDLSHKSYMMASEEEAVWAKMAGMVPRDGKLYRVNDDFFELDPPF